MADAINALGTSHKEEIPLTQQIENHFLILPAKLKRFAEIFSEDSEIQDKDRKVAESFFDQADMLNNQKNSISDLGLLSAFEKKRLLNDLQEIIRSYNEVAKRVWAQKIKKALAKVDKLNPGIFSGNEKAQVRNFLEPQLIKLKSTDYFLDERSEIHLNAYINKLNSYPDEKRKIGEKLVSDN